MRNSIHPVWNAQHSLPLLFWFPLHYLVHRSSSTWKMFNLWDFSVYIGVNMIERDAWWIHIFSSTWPGPECMFHSGIHEEGRLTQSIFSPFSNTLENGSFPQLVFHIDLSLYLRLDNGLLMMNIKKFQSSPNPSSAVLVMDCIKSYFVVRRVQYTHFQVPLSSASVKPS